MGYQPTNQEDEEQHSKFKQIEFIQHNYGVGYCLLDRDNVVWIFGEAFTNGSSGYVFRYNNNISNTTPTRFFRNVKKLCKQYGTTADGHIMFIGTDDKLYYYGQPTSITGTSNSYTNRCSTPIEMLSNVKDAWSYSTYFSGAGGVTETQTHYALTKSGVLYACGYNGDKRFGNGQTTSSDTWVQVLDNVEWFKIVETGNTPILVAKKSGGIYIANYSISTEVGTISGSKTYDAFTLATTVSIDLSSNLNGVKDVISRLINLPYLYYDTSDLSSATTIYKTALCLIKDDMLLADIGFGFARVFDTSTGFSGCKEITPNNTSGAGFSFSDGTNIKTYWNTSGTISTVTNNDGIKKLYEFDGNIVAYITRNNDYYAFIYGVNSKFTKFAENVDFMNYSYPNYCYVTLDNDVYYGGLAVYTPYSNTKMPDFVDTNTYWQN